MNDFGRDALILRYLDGLAGSEEIESLNRLLKTDADARSLLREMSFQALTLSDLSQGRSRRDSRRSVKGASRWNVRALAGAAALLLVGTPSLVWFLGSDRSLVTVVSSTGSVSWRSQSGNFMTNFEAGTPLGPGTLTLEGSESAADLRFEDGSSLTLSGVSEVSFPGDNGKRLFLRRGSISVEARRQSLKRPMVLGTPTAEVEVVGTRFSLTAQSGQTLVTVAEGRVRMRRLVDNASTEVSEGQMAVASLDAAPPLESRAIPALDSRWRQSFESQPPPEWQGEWIPADSSGPGRLRNVLDVSYRRPDGTIVPAYVVSVRVPSGITTVRQDSVLRVKWRLRAPTDQVVMLLSVDHLDGKFAGNFQSTLKTKAFPPDADGWRTFSAPISSLEIKYPKGATPPPLGRVSFVFIACYSPKVNLEISEVALE
jgi:ferric-dicitrate binding protein FerR (iron transport regulator)